MNSTASTPIVNPEQKINITRNGIKDEKKDEKNRKNNGNKDDNNKDSNNNINIENLTSNIPFYSDTNSVNLRNGNQNGINQNGINQNSINDFGIGIGINDSESYLSSLETGTGTRFSGNSIECMCGVNIGKEILFKFQSSLFCFYSHLFSFISPFFYPYFLLLFIILFFSYLIYLLHFPYFFLSFILLSSLFVLFFSTDFSLLFNLNFFFSLSQVWVTS